MKRTLTILAPLVLVLAARAAAQVKSGEATMNLNGTVSAGYGDDYSNVAGSDHSVAGAGEADLTGMYFNPNFLSFEVQPFYNQSRLNSTFQSMTASSGVYANAKLFGGSSFPGTISFADVYNNSGNFGVPGLTNFTTHGNDESLAINWGVHLHNLPSLHFSFSDSNSDFSIYGSNTLGRLHDMMFSATATYRVAGFDLNGGYGHTGTQAETPEFLTSGPSEQTDSGLNSYYFGIAHNLPWHGSVSASAARYDISTQLGGSSSPDKYDTSIDTLTAGLSVAPLSHLTLGETTYYTDNLAGTLYNTLLTAGVIVPQNEAQPSSHDLSVTGYANYDIPAENLHFSAFTEHQQQTFLGLTFADDSYNGTAAYTKWLLGGTFNGVLGLTYTDIETTHQSLLGMNTSVNYTRAIRRWSLAGSFGYSQDTQSVLIAYTTSGYNYSGSVGRRIGRRSHWGINASGVRSLLTGVPGSASSSQNYSTSLALSRFSLNASYSESSGNSLLTPAGLVATPIPLPILNPAEVVLFNGKSYSAGLTSTPIRALTFSAAYANARSATNSNSLVSNNNFQNMYFTMTYHLRKLNLQAGYNRLAQGFSVSGAPPTVVGSYYVGVSRWFNFF